MADITVSSIYKNYANAVTVNDGAASFTIPTFDIDDKIIILIDNQDSSDASLNILATNAVGDSADLGALELEVDAGKAKATIVESARFKNSSGKLDCTITDQDGTAHSGTVADVKVSVLKLLGDYHA